MGAASASGLPAVPAPLTTEQGAAVERLAAAWSGARRLFVLTGAGVSAESGLPTFRGPDGLWRGHDPTRLASPEGFRSDARLVWEFYLWRRAMAAAARPNPAHTALARLEGMPGLEVLLVTQNVDGLHAAAGSARAVELHGALFTTRCFDCARPAFEDRPGTAYGELPPRCDRCGGRLRPGVVWFGESIDGANLGRILTWLDSGPVDGCLVVGTTALIGYIHTMTLLARRAGARVVEVQLDDAPHLAPDEWLRAPAGTVLPALVEALAARRAASAP